MCKFKIEKGVPIPPPSIGGKTGERNKYPWPDLEVGDSIFIKAAGSIPVSTYTIEKRNPPKTFTQRKVSGGYRIWRTEDKKIMGNM